MIVGTIGSPRRADVRGGGTIVLAPGTPEEIAVEWWVGADDRWHIPSSAITTRQHLVRNMPIVQTSVRIPSGDAIATAFAAVQGPRELVVLDVENRSKVPFALAMVLRGPGVRDVTVTGSIVRVGGFPLLHLPRGPQRSACVGLGEDLEAVVTSGRAGMQLPAITGPCEAAFLIPVTHTTTARIGLLLGASSAVALMGSPVLASLPDVHALANGWGLQLARGMSIRLPDASLNDRFESLSAGLLLASEPLVVDGHDATANRAVVAEALDLLGFHAEAGALLEDAPDRQGRRGGFHDAAASDEAVTATVVRALGVHAALTGDGVFASTMAPTVGAALELVLKRAKKGGAAAPWTAACRAAADLFTVAGDGRAAKQSMRAWESGGAVWPMPVLPLEPLPALSVGGALVPASPRRLATAMRELLESVAVLDADGAVDLLRGFAPEWRGQSIEARNVPTPSGRLSFAIRWHGPRAALLWDVAALDRTAGPTAEPLRLRASAVDPAWSGSGAKGDALLTPRL